MRTKGEIRSLYIKKRKELGVLERQRLSQKIADQAKLYLLDNKWMEHIHVFLPIQKLYEINTWLLIQEMYNLRRKVYTSVTDFEMNVMRTVSIDTHSEFTTDKFGLPVPVNPLFIGEGQQMDLVFVPLLAFDLKGVRVGYGKGFYDKFFATMNGEVRKIGLSYFPAADLLPQESHDVLLNGCILPDQRLHFKN
ncbi:MAG TPA: 5-formyltetrahydrofolate cyclo-ligase [Lunatimonas sp.]|nr:5-formyltetrahydrofolate cyclo-ligase [Lunatimonas sp.]